MAAITQLTFKPDTIAQYGITDAVPNSRTITINGTTLDLSANRSYTVSGTGLTSVGLTVPSGFSVSNSPLTANGNIGLSFASGFSLPTDVRQSQWDSSYNFTSIFPSQTGNGGKFLTTNGTNLSFATVTQLSDGDKGDITISGSGTIFSIDPQVVSYSKIQNVAANTFLANVTGVLASVQEIATNRTVIFSSAITGTPSATTFLRGDGSFQTPSLTPPAGVTTDVQFNNAGAFGGATNVKIDNGDLALVDAGFPNNAAANRTKIYTDSIASRRFVGSIDSNGIHHEFQPSIFNSSIFMLLVGNGATLGINYGTSFIARNNGTAAAQSTPTRTSTSAITSLNRYNYSTGSTTTGASGIQSTTSVCFRGNAANLGGFFFFSRFGLETINGTFRTFVGISENNATLNANPTTLNNTCGIGNDSGDTTYSIITRSGTTTSKTNTTILLTAGLILDLYMFASPNGANVNFEVRNSLTNAVLFTHTETTNLPVSTIFLFMQSHIQSVTVGTAKVLALNNMYLESVL